ncbi:restriction endonuclease subunit S, partial [Bacteroides caecimuris]|uniref:restriction endonuclease subunit S n=3 Tax=Bacteria TaxID=2 RepID=UPI001559410B
KYKRGVIRTLLTPEYCKFKDAKWTSARIGDLGSFIKGAPLSKADIADEGTPFILYGELYTTYNEVITQIVRKTKANVEQQYFSQIGDVIIPTSGETPEEISTASCVMVPGVILGGDLNIFRCSKVDGRIISYILNHVVSRNIARIAQGKSVVHVQANELAKIEIAYPDFKTQENMVTLFEAINAKIAQRTKELELLLEQRRALLQQVFI